MFLCCCSQSLTVSHRSVILTGAQLFAGMFLVSSKLSFPRTCLLWRKLGGNKITLQFSTRFDAVGPDFFGTCRPFQKKTCSGFLLPGHLEAQRHKDICRFAGVCLSGSRISLSSTAKNSRQMQTAKLQLRPKWKTRRNMLQPLESVGTWCPHKRPTHYPTTSTFFWFGVLWCWEFQCLRAEAVEPP